MCGIIGYIGERAAAPFLVQALKRLEYRGYDSAGIATLGAGLEVRKAQGQIVEIEKNTQLSKLSGTVGIGHTRWATCGVPSEANAHPHTDCKNEIAIVHNGIIENYVALKEELEAAGHTFTSETDSEVLAHLIESLYNSNIEGAFVAALKKLRGSFAVLAVSTKEPDKLLAARHESPLVLGLGENEFFAASDIPAFLAETKETLALKDGEYAILSKAGVELKKLEDQTSVTRDATTITWSAEAAEKGGYDYFALKEINEIPNAVRDTLKNYDQKLRESGLVLTKGTRILFLACGTSYHAALFGSQWFRAAGRDAHALIASEFDYAAPPIDKNTLVIAISQSGETADTLQAVRSAKKKGAKILGITNVLGSSLEREADHILHTAAGPEIAVIATKTFVTQLVLLKALADGNTSNLSDLPNLLDKTIASVQEPIQDLAQEIKDAKHAYFIGRGAAYPLVLEGALKLKEISYIHAEGMPAGELKHGTLSLIEKDVPALVALTPKTASKTYANMDEIRAREGTVIALTSEQDKEAAKHADRVIQVPDAPEELLPILQVIPLQLLAYYTTVALGRDPDKPRNLAKCVTVE